MFRQRKQWSFYDVQVLTSACICVLRISSAAALSKGTQKTCGRPDYARSGPRVIGAQSDLQRVAVSARRQLRRARRRSVGARGAFASKREVGLRRRQRRMAYMRPPRLTMRWNSKTARQITPALPRRKALAVLTRACFSARAPREEGSAFPLSGASALPPLRALESR